MFIALETIPRYHLAKATGHAQGVRVSNACVDRGVRSRPLRPDGGFGEAESEVDRDETD